MRRLQNGLTLEDNPKENQDRGKRTFLYSRPAQIGKALTKTFPHRNFCWFFSTEMPYPPHPLEASWGMGRVDE